MTFLADFVLAIVYLVRGILDAILGRKRRRYDINVPRDIVWNTTNTREFSMAQREVEMRPGVGAVIAVMVAGAL